MRRGPRIFRGNGFHTDLDVCSIQWGAFHSTFVVEKNEPGVWSRADTWAEEHVVPVIQGSGTTVTVL
ncbi:hypothetical protein DEU38_12823 [Rhodococcus sp. AG1013]|nr:hypothetical protein DEU38_12823 [Rhodococcus sp. AG1013]